MTLDLAERRALLRQALQGDDPADFSGFATAVAGASPDDRTSLARTLPPSRLIREEGPTSRAAFVVTALGRPQLVAETVAPLDRRLKEQYRVHHPEMIVAVLAAARDRDVAWVTEFVDRLCDQAWWDDGLIWPVCHGLVRDRGLPLESVEYLGLFVRQVTGERQGDPAPVHAARITQRLLAEPELIEKEFWALFRVEGCGVNHLLSEYCAEAWNTAILALCAELPGFRDRLLDESLRALLRDFSAKNVLWYHRLHRVLDPTAAEVAARQHDYLAVLTTAPSTAVGLAQDMLARTDHIEPTGLLEASATVLHRSEKKLVKAQLGLLGTLAKADPSLARSVSDLVAEVVEHLPLDLAAVAAKLVDGRKEPQPGPETAPPGRQAPIAVPAPRTQPLPAPPEPAPLTDPAQAAALIAEHLENEGDGADLPRIIAFLAGNPPPEPALLDRARAVIRSGYDPLHASPRRQLAARLLALAGEQTEVEFRGFIRHELFRMDEVAPPEYIVEIHTSSTSTFDEDGELRVIDTSQSQWGYTYLPTDMPMGLLANSLQTGEPIPPVPAAVRTWRRVLAQPGQGSYRLDTVPGPVPTWVSEQLTDGLPVHRRLTNVDPIAEEFTFRVTAAREQGGYDRIVEWTAWVLRDHPDTLAAIEHPALWAVTRYPGVRGVAATLAALGAAHRVPGEPTYSALALAASAKAAEPRAQAAEAIAGLCDSGLLDPAGFAEQLAAHLADGFVMAGRLATTLADAASISALAGYRMLQTLEALLDRLDGINQAGKLIELTARLAADYSVRVTIPAALAAKRKGGSALAVALRALEGMRPSPTPLAREAAAQAQATLTEGGHP